MNNLNDKEPPQFDLPLNEEIFSRATDMKSQRATLEARLSKIEESRGNISERVHKKVLKEYQEQMNTLTQQITTLKEEIEQEVDNLSEQKMLAELALRDIKDGLEEMKLRHELGELEEREFKIEQEKKQATLARIQKELKTLEINIGKYRTLFAGEEAPRPAEPETPAEADIELKSEKPVVDESDYIYLPEDEDAEGFEEAPAEESPYKEDIAPQLIVKEKGVVRQEINLGDGTLFIGRSPSNQLPLPDPKISRKHAAVDFKKDHYVICDLGSANGTFVGGKKIKEQVLKSGDEIKIGQYTLLFKA